jgi:hypothetical protein
LGTVPIFRPNNSKLNARKLWVVSGFLCNVTIAATLVYIVSQHTYSFRFLQHSRFTAQFPVSKGEFAGDTNNLLDRFLMRTIENGEPLPTLSEQQSTRLMDQLAECPLLLRIFDISLWANMGLSALHHVLNVSCDELRAAICRLRPIFGEDLANIPTLSRIIPNVNIKPASWRENISTDLALSPPPEIDQSREPTRTSVVDWQIEYYRVHTTG